MTTIPRPGAYGPPTIPQPGGARGPEGPQGPVGPEGPEGPVGPIGPSVYVVTVGWVAGSDPNDAVAVTLIDGGTVTRISGTVETPEGGTATVQPVWAPNATALSGGTNLTTAAFDADGAAATNQVLTLSGSVVVPAGGRIGLQTTGTFTASVATMTIEYTL